MTANEYREKHEQLMKKWIEEYHAADGVLSFAIDGIIDPEAWFDPNNNDERILFVLKEAYDLGEDIPAYVDRTRIPSGQPYPRIWNLANHLYGKKCTELCSKENPKECLNCRNFSGTYGGVVSLVYGVLYDTHDTDYDHFSSYCSGKDANARRIELLRKTAVINIKKPDGWPNSQDEDLFYYAVKDAEKIRKQISLINPTTIICGRTYSMLRCIYPELTNLCDPNPDKSHTGNGFGLLHNGVKVIATYHPSRNIRSRYIEVVKNYMATTACNTVNQGKEHF